MKENANTDYLWIAYGIIFGAAFGHVEIGLIIGALLFFVFSYRRKKDEKS
ncbi:hypothetical protein [Clostridium vincentii]|uniref:Uncharacterized protein n=1 Tax=Clostridium vincentii TaxID=52704 RepID=A0A2T0B969_9CLOT|nr:hypothetical protein [Clostridium vincentii]PRR80373.1 hypothetical protein CLVI_30600 [Clostridium vincentii]